MGSGLGQLQQQHVSVKREFEVEQGFDELDEWEMAPTVFDSNADDAAAGALSLANGHRPPALTWPPPPPPLAVSSAGMQAYGGGGGGGEGVSGGGEWGAHLRAHGARKRFRGGDDDSKAMEVCPCSHHCGLHEKPLIEPNDHELTTFVFFSRL